jgi:lipoate-protein ligase A
MTSLSAELGRPVGAQEAQAALIESFERVMRLNLLPSELTANERLESERLAIEKYGAEKWIAKS